MASDVLQKVIYDLEISDSDTKSLDEVNDKVDNLGNLFQKASKYAKGFFIGIAAKEVLEFGVAVADSAEKLNIAQKTLSNFAKESGRDFQELMNSMREASGNTMTDMELISKANVAKMFNIQTPVDQMLELARKQAKITGDSIDYVFESLVTGTARKSKQIIDNLGLIVDQTKAEKAVAKQLEKTVQELTQAEKDRAFELAVIAGLQENIARAGVDSTVTIEEVGKKINVVYTQLKDVLGQTILPTISKIAQGVSSTLDDFLLILQQAKAEDVRKEITEAENKRNELIRERLVLVNRMNDAKAQALNIFSVKELDNARTMLMNSQFGERLDKNKELLLRNYIESQDNLLKKSQEIIKANKAIKDTQKKSSEEANKNYIARKKGAELLKKEKEEIIKIQIEREKLAMIEAQRPKQLEALRLMEEQTRIASIEDEKQRIIELNKFELDEAKKKYNSLNEEEIKRLEDVYKLRLNKQLENINKQLETTTNKGAKEEKYSPLSEMRKRMEKDSEGMLFALDTFAVASNDALTSIVQTGKASLTDLKNIWFQQAAARLTAIATEAATLALFSTAEGFLTGNPGYFTAAGIYAQAALAAGVGARLLSANISGGTEKTSQRISNDRERKREENIRTTNEEDVRQVTIVNRGIIGDPRQMARVVGNELKKDNRRTNFNIVNRNF